MFHYPLGEFIEMIGGSAHVCSEIGFALPRLINSVPVNVEIKSAKMSVNATLFISAPISDAFNFPIEFVVFMSIQLFLGLFLCFADLGF